MTAFHRIFAVLAIGAATTAAAAWPERPVRYILHSAAGGGPDIAARIVMAQLGRQLGQQIVVDNRPGASGTIGIEALVKSTPDGYTIGHGNIQTLAIVRSLMPRLPYNVDRELQPVVHMYGTPNLMAVSLSLPVNSVQELIAYAKANPGKLNFASSGNGTSIHLSAELFKTMTGVQMAHIPYKGSAPALQDLAGGQVQLMFDNLPSSLALIKAGRLKALAVTSKARAQALPDVPTIAESGLPGFEASSWFGLLVPTGTPQPVIAKVNAEIAKWLATPEAKEKLLAQGATAAGGTPEDFARHIAAETAKWQKVVKESGAKID